MTPSNILSHHSSNGFKCGKYYLLNLIDIFIGKVFYDAYLWAITDYSDHNRNTCTFHYFEICKVWSLFVSNYLLFSGEICIKILDFFINSKIEIFTQKIFCIVKLGRLQINNSLVFWWFLQCAGWEIYRNIHRSGMFRRFCCGSICRSLQCISYSHE